MPKISVIIPSYNCAAYLATAVESVLAQTYTDHEIIVVDDGSTDTTAAAIAPYLDRVQFIRQANKGLPGARNTGIRASTGELIALLDADDSWLPQKLALQLPAFDDPSVGIVYSDFSVQYSDGRFLDSYLANRPLASEGFIVDSYIRSRYLFPSTMVLRREAMEGCGLFDEEMVAAEDIELFARICLRWKVVRIPQALMIRTEGVHNITANTEKLSRYTILAFHKILQREPAMPAPTKATLHKELALQYWYRGYADFQAGRSSARQNLIRAARYDKSKLRVYLPLLLATLLPRVVVDRIRKTDRSDRTA